MPAPEKTTRDAIVAAGRSVIEANGVDSLTMQAVADRVGVRAPSLYKRVRDRRELLALVIDATLDDLTGRIQATAVVPDPRARIMAQANALREFAREQPVGFSLVFGAHGGPTAGDSVLAQAVSPLLDAVAAVSGPEHALNGARLLTAWANGFITMELSGAFRMGDDIDAAWRWGLERIVATLG